MNRAFKALGAVAAFVWGAGCLRATAITYTETGFLTGSLNNVEFASLVTFTEVSDPSGAGHTAGGSQSASGVDTIYIESLGLTATAVDTWEVFTNIGGYGGFLDNTQSGYLMATVDPSFATYDLTTSFGPVSNIGFNSPGSFLTSAGALNLNGFEGQTTFTATLGDTSGGPTSGAPEPATLALVGLGLLATGTLRRFR